MRRLSSHAGWIVSGVLGVVLTASWAGAVSGGQLDPPGAPSSTMKSLADIPGSWHRLLSDSGDDACNTQRFTCVMGAAAVLDNETGLVWEMTPGGSGYSWNDAVYHCSSITTGGRMGWRLPTVDELSTLVYPASSTSPKIPGNTPFIGITGVPFWTASDGADGGRAIANFAIGQVGGDSAEVEYRTWCVRAPHHER